MRTALHRIADRAFRLAKAGGAVALLSAGVTFASATSSQAFFNAEQTQHIIECAGWLLSDPEKHAANCLPSRVVVGLGSLSEAVTPYTAPPIVPPVQTPPTQEDECDDYEYWCECYRDKYVD